MKILSYSIRHRAVVDVEGLNLKEGNLAEAVALAKKVAVEITGDPRAGERVGHAKLLKIHGNLYELLWDEKREE